ncbi:MAG: hypothetical protein PGN25_20380 [Methylorubrum populi]
MLLDTHVLIALTQGRLPLVYPKIAALLERNDPMAWASVVSLWEIAIKTRLNKLAPGIALEKLASFFELSRLKILIVDQAHVVHELEALPALVTRSISFCSRNARSRT